MPTTVNATGARAGLDVLLTETMQALIVGRDITGIGAFR